MNLYLPTNPKFAKYKSHILQWNNLLETKKIKYNYKIIDIYTLLNNDEDFTNDYEPSEIGGTKITNAIYLSI